MIDLYGSPTPNVLKIEMMLEELNLEYRIIPINVWKGEQFAPPFVELNPNSKVPVLVDHSTKPMPTVVFESAAILIFLAEKHGRFLPKAGAARYEVLQWTIFQAAGIGPISGQFTHFHRFADESEVYSRSRYATELNRLYSVMDRRLNTSNYLGGADFSIADMATLPWVINQSKGFRETHAFLDISSTEYTAIAAWAARCLARPGVKRGLDVHAELKSGLLTASPDDKDRFFGRGRYAYASENTA